MSWYSSDPELITDIVGWQSFDSVYLGLWSCVNASNLYTNCWANMRWNMSGQGQIAHYGRYAFLIQNSDNIRLPEYKLVPFEPLELTDILVVIGR